MERVNLHTLPLPAPPPEQLGPPRGAVAWLVRLGHPREYAELRVRALRRLAAFRAAALPAAPTERS